MFIGWTPIKAMYTDFGGTALRPHRTTFNMCFRRNPYNSNSFCRNEFKLGTNIAQGVLSQVLCKYFLRRTTLGPHRTTFNFFFFFLEKTPITPTDLCPNEFKLGTNVPQGVFSQAMRTDFCGATLEPHGTNFLKFVLDRKHFYYSFLSE